MIWQRSLEKFWKTIESSFLPLYRHFDGSFSTDSCRKLAESQLKRPEIDITETLYKEYVCVHNRQERDNDHDFLDAGGLKGGVKTLQAQEVKDPGVWHRPINEGHTRTMGQNALCLAIKNLQVENFRFLLERGA